MVGPTTLVKLYLLHSSERKSSSKTVCLYLARISIDLFIPKLYVPCLLCVIHLYSSNKVYVADNWVVYGVWKKRFVAMILHKPYSIYIVPLGRNGASPIPSTVRTIKSIILTNIRGAVNVSKLMRATNKSRGHYLDP